jgi:hypothetical protein
LGSLRVQLIMPFLGHATISKMLRYLAYLFIGFLVVLAIAGAGAPVDVSPLTGCT